jgi:hypothetical protein
MSQPASGPRATPAPKGSPAATQPRQRAGGGGGAGAASVQGQGAMPTVGAFGVSGNGAASGARQSHPAQSYSGIGRPEGHRAYAAAIARHEQAGAAGVREGDAMLRREIRRAPNLTAPQKAKAMWRLRRANRKLAGAMEATAKKAANLAKVRSEVNQEIVAGKRRRPHASAFTVQ